MHLGQTVRFVDYRDGQMRSGRVVAMKGTQVVLHEADGMRVEWKLPYTARSHRVLADGRGRRTHQH